MLHHLLGDVSAEPEADVLLDWFVAGAVTQPVDRDRDVTGLRLLVGEVVAGNICEISEELAVAQAVQQQRESLRVGQRLLGTGDVSADRVGALSVLQSMLVPLTFFTVNDTARCTTSLLAVALSARTAAGAALAPAVDPSSSAGTATADTSARPTNRRPVRRGDPFESCGWLNPVMDIPPCGRFVAN